MDHAAGRWGAKGLFQVLGASVPSSCGLPETRAAPGQVPPASLVWRACMHGIMKPSSPYPPCPLGAATDRGGRLAAVGPRAGGGAVTPGGLLHNRPGGCRVPDACCVPRILAGLAVHAAPPAGPASAGVHCTLPTRGLPNHLFTHLPPAHHHRSATRSWAACCCARPSLMRRKSLWVWAAPACSPSCQPACGLHASRRRCCSACAPSWRLTRPQPRRPPLWPRLRSAPQRAQRARPRRQLQRPAGRRAAGQAARRRRQPQPLALALAPPAGSGSALSAERGAPQMAAV